MRTRVLAVMILGVLMVLGCAAWAQDALTNASLAAAGQAEQPYWRAKVGWFMPNESALDDDLALGADLVLPCLKAYLTVDLLQAEDTDVDTETWSALAGVYRTFMLYEMPFYYGGGIGWSWQSLETPLVDRHDNDFAWEIGLGANWGAKGFVEIKYRDGGSDGNTGPILFAGTTF